jgi:putative transposase
MAASEGWRARSGVTLDGRQGHPGIVGPGPAGRAPSSGWGVLPDMKNRGVRDVFFLVCDEGMPEVVATCGR